MARNKPRTMTRRPPGRREPAPPPPELPPIDTSWHRVGTPAVEANADGFSSWHGRPLASKDPVPVAPPAPPPPAPQPPPPVAVTVGDDTRTYPTALAAAKALLELLANDDLDGEAWLRLVREVKRRRTARRDGLPAWGPEGEVGSNVVRSVT